MVVLYIQLVRVKWIRHGMLLIDFVEFRERI